MDKTFEYWSPTFECANCGKKKRLPFGCTKDDYAYKLLKGGYGGDHWYLFCGWSCFKKFKIKKAQDMIKGEGELSGHSYEQAVSWLKWVGAEVPPKGVKKKRAYKTNHPEGVSCETMVQERYELIDQMRKENVPWKYVRIKTGLIHWSSDMIRQSYNNIARRLQGE